MYNSDYVTFIKLEHITEDIFTKFIIWNIFIYIYYAKYKSIVWILNYPCQQTASIMPKLKPFI